MTVFRVTLTGIRWGKLTMQNCLHFEDISSLMTDEQVATEIRTQWCTMWAVRQASTFGWRNISIFRPGTSFTPSNFPIVVNGTDGVDASGGTNVTGLKIRILTAFAGKRGRGRFYLPAVRDQYIEFGEYNAQAITNITPTITAVESRYKSPGGSGPIHLGVRGRGTNDEFHPMIALSMSVIPGIQRRRNIGVGI